MTYEIWQHKGNGERHIMKCETDTNRVIATFGPYAHANEAGILEDLPGLAWDYSIADEEWLNPEEFKLVLRVK